MYIPNQYNSGTLRTIKKAKHRRSRHPIHQDGLRKRLRAYFIYCMTNCTTHGMIQIVREKRSHYEKMLWMGILAATVVPCVLLVQQSLNHYFHNPTVNSLERNHWIWKNDFPALTICPKSINDWDNHPIKIQFNASENFKGFLEALFFGNFSTFGNLRKYKKEFGHLIKPESYLELAHKLSRFSPDSQPMASLKGVEPLLTETVTEHGFCYSVNAKLAKYNNYTYWINNDTRTYDDTVVGVRKEEEVVLLSLNYIPGNSNEITFPFIKFTNTIFPDVFVHGSNDIVDVQNKRYFLQEYYYLNVRVTSTVMETPYSLKYLSVEQRHCRFHDESNLMYSSVYSYKLCRVDCRIKYALKKCGCIPYFYRNRYGDKICGIDGMICLSKHADELTELKDPLTQKSTCECIPNCVDEVISVLTEEYWEDIQTRLILEYVLITKVKYTKSLMFSWKDLVVQIGGLGGLCYGLSVLSAVEIIYFITLRFYYGVIRKK